MTRRTHKKAKRMGLPPPSLTFILRADAPIRSSVCKLKVVDIDRLTDTVTLGVEEEMGPGWLLPR